MRVETSVGQCTLRKRGSIWYARIQHKRQRFEFPLDTDSQELATIRAQKLVPARLKGRLELVEKGAPTKHYYSRMYCDMRARARSKGLPFDVSRDEWNNLVMQAGDRCQLTGIPFSLSKAAAGYRAPFAPSIDRIRPADGYTLANIRLVCVSVNYALADWGLGVFETVCNAFVQRNGERAEQEPSFS